MASIDLEAMARLVGAMEDVVTTVPGIRTEFNATLRRFDLPTWSTARLVDVAAWADDELPGLRRRLALARSIEASSPTWSTGTVTIDESRISLVDPAQARRDGAAAARALLTGSGVPDAALLAQIEQMQGDPYFAAGFASTLDPTELARVVTRLSGTRLPVDGSVTADEAARANAWYGRMLTAMSTTLATASHGTGDLAPPRDQAQAWVRAITAETPTDLFGDGSGTALPDQAAALGMLLGAGGAFAPSFLTPVAEGVYAYERAYADAHGSRVWYQRSSTAVTGGAGLHDPVTGALYTDPMVGVMAALARRPALAATFLAPDGGGEKSQDRARYLVEERTWAQDDLTALARALDAGGTVWHTTDATPAQQRTSAWIASAAVHHLAARPPGLSGDRVGDTAKASLGHLLAAYVADVDVVAQATAPTDVPAVTSEAHTTASWLRGLPRGAAFAVDDLNTVLRSVMTDDAAAGRLADAAAAFNGTRIEAAVAEYEADPTVGIAGPLGSSARLVGYLTGNLEQASVEAGKRVDERNKQFIGLASDLVGLIPTGGTLASFVADQARSAGKDQISQRLTGNAAAAAAAGQESAEMATVNLQIAAATALAGSAHLPASVRTDTYGKVYPWFEDGATVEGTITDPETRRLFIRWMYDDAGAIAEHLPDLSEAFSMGGRRAQR